MVMPEPRQQVEEEIRFLNILAVAMVASVAGFAIMAWLLLDLPDGFAIARDLPAPLAWFGAAIAAALLVAAPIVHGRLLARVENPSVEGDRAPLFEGYRFATILVFLLREAAAMIGLMVALISGQAVWAYALCAAAMVAMFFGWPRREELEELLRTRQAI